MFARNDLLQTSGPGSYFYHHYKNPPVSLTIKTERMKAIIIDDEPLARSIIKEYLQYHPQIALQAECSDGFEGVKAIQQFQPDLIFLDIQMPKINGFEMLELIELPPAVIFTTAFDEYAIKAFESHAVDYLLKPFSRERFDKAINKLTAAGKKRSSKTQPDAFSGFRRQNACGTATRCGPAIRKNQDHPRR